MSQATVHQIVGRGSLADPATSRALRLRRSLRLHGRSEVYGGRIDPALAGEIRPLASLDTTRDADILIFHSGSVDTLVDRALAGTRNRIVLVHTTIDVADICVTESSPAMALQRTHFMLSQLSRGEVAAIALDDLGADELRVAGFRDVIRMNLPVGVTNGIGTRPRRSGLEKYRGRDATTHSYVLTMPPTRATARHGMALHAVSLAQRVLGSELGVHVAEIGPLALETGALRELARRGRVRHAYFHAQIRAFELTDLVVGARMVVCSADAAGELLALHAMALDIPVVLVGANNSVSDGALALPRDAGPTLLAEAICAVDSDTSLRDTLRAHGRRCVDAMEAADDTAKLIAALGELDG